MNLEKWQEIKGQIKDSFKVLSEKTEPRGEDRPGAVEILEFEGPLGRMRVEFDTHPVVLEKRGLGSRRIGSQTKVEYIYSKDEFVHTFKAYKWDEGQSDWLEIEAGDSFKM